MDYIDIKQLKRSYYKLLEETDLDVLELGLKEPNIFQILFQMILVQSGQTLSILIQKKC